MFRGEEIKSYISRRERARIMGFWRVFEDWRFP